MSGIQPAEDELHAFVDGALQAARQDEVAAILRADPVLAARVAGYARGRDLLREAVTHISADPLPSVWPRRSKRQSRVDLRSVWAGATPSPPAWVLCSGLRRPQGGGPVGTRSWQMPWPSEMARQRERALPTGLLENAAARDAQLASAIGLPAHGPDLRRFGFQLAAMQLFTRGAQLRYADRGRRNLTIYVRPSDGTVRFDMLRRGTQRICIWQDNVVGAVIVAPLSAGEMMRVASKAYGDLDL